MILNEIFYFITFIFQHSLRYLDNIIKNRTSTAAFLGVNHNNCHRFPKDTISLEKLNIVRAHINFFPTTLSHYCQKDSRRLQDLNVSCMYRSYCDVNDDPISFYVYRYVNYFQNYYFPAYHLGFFFNLFNLFSVFFVTRQSKKWSHR